MDDILKQRDHNELSDSLLSLNLYDLNAPYKLCTWFRSLPHFKHEFLHQASPQASNEEAKQDADDQTICNELANFAFSNGLVGKHLMSNFHQEDFEQIVSVLHIKNAKDKSQWIWQCIEYSQKQQQNAQSQPKLQWVSNSWAQVQILCTPMDEKPPPSKIPLANDVDANVKSEKLDEEQKKEPEEELKQEPIAETLTNSQKPSPPNTGKSQKDETAQKDLEKPKERHPAAPHVEKKRLCIQDEHKSNNAAPQKKEQDNKTKKKVTKNANQNKTSGSENAPKNGAQRNNKRISYQEEPTLCCGFF